MSYFDRYPGAFKGIPRDYRKDGLSLYKLNALNVMAILHNLNEVPNSNGRKHAKVVVLSKYHVNTLSLLHEYVLGVGGRCDLFVLFSSPGRDKATSIPTGAIHSSCIFYERTNK